LVAAGKLGRPAALFGFGLLVSLLLLLRKNSIALLAGILLTTIAGALVGDVKAPAHWTSAPDFSLVGKLDWLGALRLAYVPALLAILLTDLFDSLSTFVGVAHATGLVDEDGEPRNLGRALLVDASATLFAGAPARRRSCAGCAFCRFCFWARPRRSCRCMPPRLRWCSWASSCFAGSPCRSRSKRRCRLMRPCCSSR